MQLLANLRFDKELLKKLFAREGVMIESPILQEWLEEHEIKVRRGIVLNKLEQRFGSIPADLSAAVRVVTDPKQLESLLDAAYASPSLDEFRKALTPPPAPATN
jgi:hypothetical protein